MHLRVRSGLASLALAVGLAATGFAFTAPQPAPLARGEARIRYLFHAGWAVETARHFLVFDYARRASGDAEAPSLEDGWLTPAALVGRRVVVFISHAHGDHYDPSILLWANRVEDLTVVFGWPGPAGPGRHIVADRQARQVMPDVTVSAIQHAFDGIPESAFLVRVDGIVLYHSGDHGTLSDPPNPVFTGNIDALARQVERVDLAFVSIFGGGHGRWVNAGDRHTIAALRPRVLFPMHCGGREHEYLAFAEEARRLAPDTEVIPATRPGHLFHYRDGHIG